MVGSPIVSPAILRVHRVHCTHCSLLSCELQAIQLRHVCIYVKCMSDGKTCFPPRIPRWQQKTFYNGKACFPPSNTTWEAKLNILINHAFDNCHVGPTIFLISDTRYTCCPFAMRSAQVLHFIQPLLFYLQKSHDF